MKGPFSCNLKPETTSLITEGSWHVQILVSLPAQVQGTTCAFLWSHQPSMTLPSALWDICFLVVLRHQYTDSFLSSLTSKRPRDNAPTQVSILTDPSILALPCLEAGQASEIVLQPGLHSSFFCTWQPRSLACRCYVHTPFSKQCNVLTDQGTPTSLSCLHTLL